jgi:hypothetical protein
MPYAFSPPAYRLLHFRWYHMLYSSCFRALLALLLVVWDVSFLCLLLSGPVLQWYSVLRLSSSHIAYRRLCS